MPWSVLREVSDKKVSQRLCKDGLCFLLCVFILLNANPPDRKRAASRSLDDLTRPQTTSQSPQGHNSNFNLFTKETYAASYQVSVGVNVLYI